MIVDYSVGHTGRVQDSWAFQSTCTCKGHECIFGPDECMWADSAYPSETWSVSPFKKLAKHELSPDQKTFNYHLSKVNLIHCLIRLLSHVYRSTFVLRMPLDYLKANFSHCLSSGSKSTHMRSIFGLSCGFDAVLSSIILYCKSRQGKTIGSGERNSTISGIEGRELSTDTGRRKPRQKAMMTI
jgi:hypothetical protein